MSRSPYWSSSSSWPSGDGSTSASSPWRGRRWAHLVSDESYAELHAFAERLGIPERAFQGDHYDVPAEYRDRAIELGAEPVDARILLRRLQAEGVRVGVFTDAPEELARIAVAHLGAARRIEMLEAGPGALERLLARLGPGTREGRSLADLKP